MTENSSAVGSLYYDFNSVIHVETDGDSTAFTESGERTTMHCGANLTGSGLPMSGTRLSDEYARGRMCNECLNALRGLDATVPGFMKDGELLRLHSRRTDA